VPVPSPRTPILPARGNKSDLLSNIGSLQEGEICYAQDEDALYVKEGGVLVRTTAVPVTWQTIPGRPSGTQLLDLMQWNGTDWVADRRLDGGNF
jgi:hypothetical protein